MGGWVGAGRAPGEGRGRDSTQDRARGCAGRVRLLSGLWCAVLRCCAVLCFLVLCWALLRCGAHVSVLWWGVVWWHSLSCCPAVCCGVLFWHDLLCVLCPSLLSWSVPFTCAVSGAECCCAVVSGNRSCTVLCRLALMVCVCMCPSTHAITRSRAT